MTAVAASKRKPRRPTKAKASPPKPKHPPRKIRRTKRKPRKLTKEDSTEIVTTGALSRSSLRRYAGIDYITDPHGRSVIVQWERSDREYQSLVAFKMFEEWSLEDQWVKRRERFWEEMESRTLEGLQDKLLKQRLEELRYLAESRSYLEEYMMPLMDRETNLPLRYPLNNDDGTPHERGGLPIYPLELPRFDQLFKLALDMDERIMLKRGEAVTRTQTIGEKTKLTTTALDPVGSLVSITPEEARKLAGSLLRTRLAERHGDVIDMPVEEDDDDGEDL